MRATWRPTGETGASKPRLVWELQNGLLEYRTWPPDIAIDWTDAYTIERFDVQAGLLKRFVPGPRVPPILASRQIDVAIEVRRPPAAPADVQAPSLPAPADVPAATPKVSDSALREALRACKQPEPPLGEDALREKLERQFDASIERDRFRQALKDHGAHLKLPVGRPRKKRAKKFAE
jgi:hypothetical protein